jgi:hypothetical protein
LPLAPVTAMSDRKKRGMKNQTGKAEQDRKQHTHPHRGKVAAAWFSNVDISGGIHDRFRP